MSTLHIQSCIRHRGFTPSLIKHYYSSNQCSQKDSVFFCFKRKGKFKERKKQIVITKLSFRRTLESEMKRLKGAIENSKRKQAEPITEEERLCVTG